MVVVVANTDWFVTESKIEMLVRRAKQGCEGQGWTIEKNNAHLVEVMREVAGPWLAYAGTNQKFVSSLILIGRSFPHQSYIIAFVIVHKK